MNLSKKFKRQTTDQDDDIIIIESLSSDSRNEICQHVDQATGEQCQSYVSVLCMHCQLYLCFIHLEVHRILLIDERDRLSDQFNERVDHLCQWRAHPMQCQAFLMENYQVKFKRKLSFVQRLALEKSINLTRIIDELQALLQSVRILFCQQQSVSSFQLERMRESLGQYDRKRLVKERLRRVWSSLSFCLVILEPNRRLSSSGAKLIGLSFLPGQDRDSLPTVSIICSAIVLVGAGRQWRSSIDQRSWSSVALWFQRYFRRKFHPGNDRMETSSRWENPRSPLQSPSEILPSLDRRETVLFPTSIHVRLPLAFNFGSLVMYNDGPLDLPSL